MRIVQLANFWTPSSGGLRVVMDRLASGYASRGHRVLQIVPGECDGQHLTAWGRRTSVASPVIPASGGYRMIVRLRHTERLVEAFGADVIEVSDRATLAHLAGRWTGRDVRVVLVAHERLDHILSTGSYGGALDSTIVRRLSDGWNPRCWRAVDEVVTPSRFAADEWHRIGIKPRTVPWGVDIEEFSPRPPSESIGPKGMLRLAWVGRLSAEKRPDLALDALRVLVEIGVSAQLTVVGDGPLFDSLREGSAGLPVDMRGHVSDPAAVASILRASNVSLSTSGIESFGLAVLESMACGTPVVVCDGGAAGEVAGGGGCVVPRNPAAIAAGALALWKDAEIRHAARARAEQFTWDRAVDSMLDVLLATRAVA